MNEKTLFSWKFTVADGILAVVYAAFVVFLAAALLGRSGDAPLLPLNDELDNPFWILFACLLITSFLGLVVLGLPLAWYKVKRGHWKIGDVAATLLFAAATALICYVPLSYFYENSLAPRNKFHAHLQLFPKDIPAEIERSEKTIVIAFLGGSTTAWGRWTQQVEQSLKAEFPDRSFVVLNQGIQWYTVLHSLINYESNVRHARPDIVVVMHAINDLTVNADQSYYVNGSFRRDYGHHAGPLARLTRIRPMFDLVGDVGRHMLFYRDPEIIDIDHFQGLPVFREYYGRLVDLIRMDGSQPVLMTQPYLYKSELNPAEKAAIYMDKQNSVGPTSKWSIETARRGMEQYVGTVRSLAESEQVPLFDLEAVMPKELAYLKDDCHYTEQGAALVAAHVSEGLAEVIRSMQEYQ